MLLLIKNNNDFLVFIFLNLVQIYKKLSYEWLFFLKKSGILTFFVRFCRNVRDVAKEKSHLRLYIYIMY